MTIAAPVQSQPSADQAAPRVGSEEIIVEAISQTQAALWRAELSQRLLKGLIGGMGILLGWFVVDQWLWPLGVIGRTLSLGVIAAVAIWWFWTRIIRLLQSRVRPDYAAQSLEADLPELRHSLSSYVALRETGNADGVRAAVLRTIGARAAGEIKRQRVETPSEADSILRWWMVLAASLVVVLGYMLFSPKSTLRSAQRLLLPMARIAPPTRVAINDVTPGDCRTVPVKAVEIRAKVEGLRSEDQPLIVFSSRGAMSEPMTLDPATGLYGGSITIDDSTDYRIVAGDAQSESYRITVDEIPVVSIRSKTVTPPPYTGLPAATSMGGPILAMENSQVELSVETNRPIVRAKLEFNPRVKNAANQTEAAQGPANAGVIDLKLAPDGMSGSVAFQTRIPRSEAAGAKIDSYRIVAWDAEGNENYDAVVYPIRIDPDLAPEVRFASPVETSREVPINGQLLFEIVAVDPDHGLKRIEWLMRRGVEPPTSAVIWSVENGVTESQTIEYRLRPAELGFRAGDTIQVAAAALDNREGVDGQPEPNRTVTKPIELKIVSPAALPPPTAPEAGLSQPDGIPNGDQEGSQGEPGKKESQQPGNDGSGGSQGDAQDAEDAQAENRTGAKGGGEGQDGSQAPPDGEDGSGQGSKDGNQPGEGNAEGGDNADPSASRPDDPNAMGEPSSDQPGQTDPSQTAGDSSEQDGSSTGGEKGAQGKDAQGEDQGAGQPEDASESEGGAGNDASRSLEPPSHDGDAFERIRDFLEQKRAELGQREGSSGQGAGESAGSAGQGVSKSDPANGPPGSKQPPGGNDPESQNGGEKDGSGENGPKGANQGNAPSDPSMSQGQGESQGQGQKDGAAAADPKSGVPQGQKPQAGKPSPGQSAAPEGGNPAGDPKANAEPGKNGGDSSDNAGTPADADSPGGNSQGSDSSRGSQGLGEKGPNGKVKPNAPTNPAESDAASDPGEESSAGSGLPGIGLPGGGQGGKGNQDPSSNPNGEGMRGSPNPSGGAAGGNGGVGSGSGDAGQAPLSDDRPPDPVDVDYAREATDLVLEYLEQTRDTPDPKLLERLKWTPEELADFRNRWEETLKKQPASGGDPKELEATLKSLGLRKPTRGPIGGTTAEARKVEGLMDPGRIPPPMKYRDDFEAFMRNVNRTGSSSTPSKPAPAKSRPSKSAPAKSAPAKSAPAKRVP
jgi:hypothetical protein